MDDKTAQLLEKLAAKLGTTTEYLWGVLVKQSAFSATIDLIYFISSIILGIVIFTYHRKFSKKIEEGRYADTMYDKHDGNIIIPMIIFTIIFLVLFIYGICSIPNIINGFFNPEYWALKEILNSI